MNNELYKISFEGISKDCVALFSFDLVYGKLYYVTLFCYLLCIILCLLCYTFHIIIKVAFMFRNR